MLSDYKFEYANLYNNAYQITRTFYNEDIIYSLKTN